MLLKVFLNYKKGSSRDFSYVTVWSQSMFSDGAVFRSPTQREYSMYEGRTITGGNVPEVKRSHNQWHTESAVQSTQSTAEPHPATVLVEPANEKYRDAGILNIVNTGIVHPVMFIYWLNTMDILQVETAQKMPSDPKV